ncbi:YhgE/Pip domain-containing protein [Cellulomonas shaoxiangyii]|uniref:YhgE/Pip domain-containing protein n=1 Tax=Cellulomonas shaoxiangyii TaxID=2566013 RepID=A0A4P7SI67_9CELL|nr:YhgE/Pip family protein [Cellulomonas shaoxiangyii]QCB93762.1 YhgE/Pip domain-containing protein [Cellulomonas shaoxiangyii]TGY81874.1 YhgE/Pip domain-containing protein [Cellulomonas shaoxiangyii]
MIAVRLAASELRRLAAGTLPRLALLALVVIPSLYSGLYLFANEDPYGRLHEVPAALVVSDEGATTTDAADGTTRRVDYGEQVARRLLDGDAGFRWVQTSQRDAEDGVRSGRYDAALLVGRTFSADLVSSGEFRPRQASLTLVTNDANNYLATTIADTVVDDVRDAIAVQVGTQAADRFLQGFGSIHTELGEGVQGATQLVDGVDRLSSGTADLAQGAGRLATGALQAAEGAAELAAGAEELPAASARLASGAATLSRGLDTLHERTRALPAQTRELATGAQQVAAGTAEVATVAREAVTTVRDVTARAQTGRAALAAQLAALVAEGRLSQPEADAITTLAADATQAADALSTALGDASGRLDQLSAGAAEVAGGAAELADATPALTSGIAAAASGADQLAAGTAALDGAADTLVGDLRALRTGTAEVSSGAEELATGTQTVRDGTTELQGGVTELRDRLQEGLGAIPDPDEETARATARTIGDPVRVAEDQLARAGSYGAGLAPFFMSLATWIGGYVLFLLVQPLSRRALAAGGSAWQTAVGGWLPGVLLGAGQVALMYLLVTYALDIAPVYGVATILLLLLASAAFVAILQALNVWFGAVGEFLGLVLMLVQLVTAGGTFPWQTIPEPLLSLHRLLPMSYTVEGLRQTLYGGSLAIAARDAAVLAAVFVVALAATTWAARRQRTWTPAGLQPELVL